MGWKDELNNKYDDDLFGKSSTKDGFGFDDNQNTEQPSTHSTNRYDYNSFGKNFQNVKKYIIIAVAIIFIINMGVTLFLVRMAQQSAADNDAKNVMEDNRDEQDRAQYQRNRPYRPDSRMGRRNTSNSQDEIDTIVFEGDDSERDIVRPRRRPRPDHARSRTNDSEVDTIVFGEDETSKKAVPGKMVGSLYEYDCTHSFISRDKGYGDPSSEGACPSGVARMEMEDHKASIYDAIEDCRNRGMRLPTYHELSGAANYAKELGLQSGNYWANSKDKDVYGFNCAMPRGNCGRYYSPPSKSLKQWYRCVEQ